MLHFILSITFLISILLRLVANYYQNKQRFHKRNVRNVRKSCRYHCHTYFKVGDLLFLQFSCCRCLCFAQHIIGIVIIIFIWLGTLILGDGITGKLAFIVLCWDVVIPCVLFQSFISEGTSPHVQYEQRNSKEQTMHEENEKLNVNCTVEIQ